MKPDPAFFMFRGLLGLLTFVCLCLTIVAQSQRILALERALGVSTEAAR